MSNLEDKLKAAVLATALQEEKEARRSGRRRMLRWSIPAAAAACAALLVTLAPKQPRDTFDDPALAYAEVEKTFSLISQKMEKGREIALNAEQPIEMIKTVFE